MAYSDVTVCNLALGRVGGKRIATLIEDSPGARACKAIYDPMRDILVEEHDWPFARARAALSRDATAPAFGYAYQYDLPSGFLRPLDLNGDTTKIYRVEGRLLLTDEAEANLRYIKQIIDPTEFSISFVNTLALFMATDLAMSVAKSKTLRAELLVELKSYKFPAMARNSQFDTERPPEGDGYATARN